MKKLAIALAVLFTAAVVSPAFAGDSKPWLKDKKNVTDTPSIKAMQKEKCRPLGRTVDTLGNSIPTQTDNTGKIERVK